MSNTKTIMTICHLKHLHKKVKSAKDGMSLSKNHSLLVMKACDACIGDQKLLSDKKIPVRLKKEGEDNMKNRKLSADSIQPIKKLILTLRYSTRDLIPTL